jgi:isopropylmalate/homocitrate/citramalate synthase
MERELIWTICAKTVELAIKNGATTINIPDTVGYTIPSEFTTIIETLLNKVPNIDKAILSTHCHNDLGLGSCKLFSWSSSRCKTN